MPDKTKNDGQNGYVRVIESFKRDTTTGEIRTTSEVFDIIARGDWDCPENAIAALMKRVAAGRDLFDQGEIIGKAITLQQPYASFMAVGEKLIETRSWSTKYRGTVFIHAAKRLPSVGWETMLHFQNLLDESAFLANTQLEELPRSCLIACGTLVDCVEMDLEFCRRMDETREGKLGFYAPHRFAWMFEDMQPLPELVPMQGQLSLWDVRI